MKKIFLLLLTIISNIYGANTYETVPTKYLNNIKIFSPVQNIITIKDTLLIKGQVKNNMIVEINKREVNLNEAGRFNEIIDLDTLGHNEIIIGFRNDNEEFNVKRSIIKLKNPNESILNQKELAFINTDYASPKIKNGSLKSKFRNNEFAFFLSKIDNSNKKENLEIKNLDSLDYQNEVQKVINSRILTLDNENNFKKNSIINLPIFLTGLTRALNWNSTSKSYPDLEKYENKWYYDYLVIGFEKGIINKKDLKSLKKAFKNQTFVKYAARVPELSNDILAELKFKPNLQKKAENLPSKIVVNKNKKIEIVRIENNIIQKKKAAKLTINSVEKISKSRKKVKGETEPNSIFVVNWKKINVDDKGKFNFVVPLNQNSIQLSVNDTQFIRDLSIENYKEKPVIVQVKKPKKEIKKIKVIEKEISKNEFKDLENHWVKDIANKLKAQNKLDNTQVFNPNKTISRSEMAKHLVKITGVIPKKRKLEFEDISNKNKNYGYIQNVVSNKLLKGRNKKTFDPNGDVTKLQAIIVAARMLPDIDSSKYSSIKLPYNDIKKYGWAKKEIQKAYYYKVINKNKSLFPKKKVTNAELISILYKTSTAI